MAQLSIAQRTFIVKTFYETGSLQETRNQFRERFPERQNLALRTIWYNVRKFEQNSPCVVTRYRSLSLSMS
jgi:hypothetical protein